jgi:hypothetical protein
MARPSPTSDAPSDDDRSLTRANVDGEPAPRLPHERDESSDEAGKAKRPVIEKAGADLAAGRTATDRSEATNDLYERTLRGG